MTEPVTTPDYSPAYYEAEAQRLHHLASASSDPRYRGDLLQLAEFYRRFAAWLAVAPAIISGGPGSRATR
jgi:hypothetical protein